MLLVFHVSLTAQILSPGHYVGYPTNSPSGTPMEIFVGLNGEIAAKYGEEISRRVIDRPNGTLLANFSPRLRFRGVVSGDGTSVDGRLLIHETRRSSMALYYRLTPTHETTPVRLTALTMWMAHPNGYFTENTGMVWDTFGGIIFNVYLFSGLPAAPVFLNAGNNDLSLGLDLQLLVGRQTFHFSGEYPFDGTLAMNFYFDYQTTPRISARIPTDGSNNFSPVASGLQTFGGRHFDRVQPSAGTLTFVEGDFRITLTDLQTILPRVDLVAPDANTSTYPADDTTGRFTLTIVPEAWTNLWSRQHRRTAKQVRL
jgi:hypothetical protein